MSLCSTTFKNVMCNNKRLDSSYFKNQLARWEDERKRERPEVVEFHFQVCPYHHIQNIKIWLKWHQDWRTKQRDTHTHTKWQDSVCFLGSGGEEEEHTNNPQRHMLSFWMPLPRIPTLSLCTVLQNPPVNWRIVLKCYIKKQVSHQRMGSFIGLLDGTQDRRFPDRETLKRAAFKSMASCFSRGVDRVACDKKHPPQPPCVLIQLTPQQLNWNPFHLSLELKSSKKTKQMEKNNIVRMENAFAGSLQT